MAKQKPSRSESRASSSGKNKTKSLTFPVVGIGASAGGLEALRELLSQVPKNTGMAFIVIQHLDPKHGSMTPEILGRDAKIPVHEIKEGVRIEPNQVYVIPPNFNLDLVNGQLHLLPRTEARGQHMAVDFFFQALARELGSRAIAVVLSGIATDGTRGLVLVKGMGGITFAQEPKSAKYDGMPRSAIASGAVDLILTPKAIAAELTQIAKHPYIISKRKSPKDARQDESLIKIFSLLGKITHVDFSHYKHSTILRRISKRMLLQKEKTLTSYAKYLGRHPEEVKALFSDVLIPVTGFFRDPKTFDALKTHVLPMYMKSRNPSHPFRVWVPGCSTGEEAYSIAMTFIEVLDNSVVRTPLSIFATDLSERALQKARAAVYPESISHDVSKRRLARFFEKADGGGYRIVKWLRDTCLFSRHDVTRDPPFSKVDLISCRNVLIYFDSELQKRVMPIFHYALNFAGILVLGKSEALGTFSNIFTPVDKDNKIYTKKNTTTPLKLQFPISLYPIERLAAGRKIPEPQPGWLDLQRESERIALTEYAPPSVLVNSSLDIVQSRGRTTPFLGLSTGQPSFNLLRMAHPELIGDLRLALQAARKKKTPQIKEGVCFHDDGVVKVVTLRVIPFPVAAMEPHFIVFFELIEDKTKEHAKVSKKNKPLKEGVRQERTDDIQRRIIANQEYQQSLVEEYETTQEELIASNEELQSTNEELQSTNEELETAKEELQSANEELTTVNDEMQTRNAEMAQLNNDLINLLSSVDIPIVMVSAGGQY